MKSIALILYSILLLSCDSNAGGNMNIASRSNAKSTLPNIVGGQDSITYSELLIDSLGFRCSIILKRKKINQDSTYTQIDLSIYNYKLKVETIIPFNGIGGMTTFNVVKEGVSRTTNLYKLDNVDKYLICFESYPGKMLVLFDLSKKEASYTKVDDIFAVNQGVWAEKEIYLIPMRNRIVGLYEDRNSRNYNTLVYEISENKISFIKKYNLKIPSIKSIQKL